MDIKAGARIPTEYETSTFVTESATEALRLVAALNGRARPFESVTKLGRTVYLRTPVAPSRE